jgi:hypothetical protein
MNQDHQTIILPKESVRRVDPEQVEVVSESSGASPFEARSQVKVIQGGPVLFLLGTLFLPVIIFALLMLGFFALFFGRGVFKMIRYSPFGRKA